VSVYVSMLVCVCVSVWLVVNRVAAGVAGW